MRVLQEGRARGGTFHHLRVTLWNTQSRQHFPLKTIPPDLSDSINWHFQLISHTQRHAANGADSSGALTHLVICAPMECDIRNRIWAAWHLLHFQLNQSQGLQVLWLTCQSSSLRALVTPLLWADPWHISASSMETAAGNCLQPGETGHGQKQECTVRGCNTRKKPPTFYPLSSCLSIAKSETQRSLPQSLSALSGKDAACKYQSLLAQEKPHCRRQHTMDPSPVYLGSKKLNLFCKSI